MVIVVGTLTGPLCARVRKKGRTNKIERDLLFKVNDKIKKQSEPPHLLHRRGTKWLLS